MGKKIIRKHLRNDWIATYFYNLANLKKPDVNKSSDLGMVMWFVKYKVGLLYFALFGIYRDVLSTLTKYYPFSLLYQDRLFHADNLPIRSLMEEIESMLKKNNINLTVISGYAREPFCVLLGEDADKKWLSDTGIKEIETVLKGQFPQIYVRRNDDSHLEFLIPYEEVFPEN